jgi:CHAT domain-containing protein
MNSDEILNLVRACKTTREFVNILKSKIDDETGSYFKTIGDILYNHSFLNFAIETWNLAISVFKEKKDDSNVVKCLIDIGMTYSQLGNFEKANEYYKNVIKISAERGYYEDETKGYIGLASICRIQGRFRDAIKYHEKVLYLAKKTKDYELESLTRSVINNDYKLYSEQRTKNSINENYKDREMADRDIATVRELSKSIESPLETIRKLEQILEKTQLDGQRKLDLEYLVYENISKCYERMGEYRKYIEYLEKCLKICQEKNYLIGIAHAYCLLGLAWNFIGDNKKFLENSINGAKTAEKTYDPVTILTCYATLSQAYITSGDLMKAVEYSKASLELSKTRMDKFDQIRCMIDLGNIYSNLKDLIQSKKYYEEALHLAQETKDKDAESWCLLALAGLYRYNNDVRKAIELTEECLKVNRENRREMIRCYMHLGWYWLQLSKEETAIRYLQEALQIEETLESKEFTIPLYGLLGICYMYKEPEKAHSYFELSINAVESSGSDFIQEEQKIAFYGKSFNAYTEMIVLCVLQHKNIEAFEYLERSKSKAFLDLLATSEIKASDDVLLRSQLNSLLEKEKRYLVQLRKIKASHLTRILPTPAAINPFKESSDNYYNPIDIEPDLILKELDKIYDKMEPIDPEYVSLRRVKPLTSSKIQNILSQKGNNTMLVEYFIALDKTYIFVISADEFYIETVQLSKEKIKTYIESYLREVVNYLTYGDIGNTWLELSSYLIKPISKYLFKADMIYFVPFDLLHYLPLHVLELNGEPLIKSHAVTYSPSASILQFLNGKSSAKINGCSAFGIVTGQEKYKFKQEAEEVAALFNSRPFIDATKNIVFQNTNNDILHFACHGKFNDTDPLSSGVKLYDDMLTARDIFNFKLNAELVTLSACETGINEAKPGDELIGLTRALIYAGTSSVIVSLWSVYDPSTIELMLEFYQQLKNGKDKATALQQAQIKIMEKEEYSHPYYWAPFVLVGDWE